MRYRSSDDPLYIAQLKERIAALRSHQQCILEAVLLGQDVGCAVEERTSIFTRRDRLAPCVFVRWA